MVQGRTERDDLRPQRVWTLHAGEHAAAIERKAVPGIGAGIRAEPRVRDHEAAQLREAIACGSDGLRRQCD